MNLNGYQAIVRGPVVLARDARFGDGLYLRISCGERKKRKGRSGPFLKKPANIWMSFTAPLVLGTDLEGDFRNPKQLISVILLQPVIHGVKIHDT